MTVSNNNGHNPADELPRITNVHTNSTFILQLLYVFYGAAVLYRIPVNAYEARGYIILSLGHAKGQFQLQFIPSNKPPESQSKGLS